jgi:hypothetical protein
LWVWWKVSAVMMARLAAMMLVESKDIQWYCIEYVCSFNDLVAEIVNGSYLHGTITFPHRSCKCFVMAPG